MTPAQQAKLESLAGRALTAGEIICAQDRQDSSLAASISAGRNRTVSTLIDAGTVMRVLGPVSGATLLDALSGLAATNRPVYWAMKLLDAGRLDVGDPNTQAQLNMLAAGGALTQAQANAMIALSQQSDPIQIETVSHILNEV